MWHIYLLCDVICDVNMYNVSFYPFDILPCGTKLGCFFCSQQNIKKTRHFLPHTNWEQKQIEEYDNPYNIFQISFRESIRNL